MYKILIPSVLCFMLVFAGCTNTPDIIIKGVPGEQSVKAKQGKSFSIQLESQMSTGYSWKLKELPASFKIINETVETEGGYKTGGIDIQEFIFTSSVKGEYTFIFMYGEHWKEKPKYIKTSLIKVLVE